VNAIEGFGVFVGGGEGVIEGTMLGVNVQDGGSFPGLLRGFVGTELFEQDTTPIPKIMNT